MSCGKDFFVVSADVTKVGSDVSGHEAQIYDWWRLKNGSNPNGYTLDERRYFEYNYMTADRSHHLPPSPGALLIHQS